jgi:thiol:disulfide interchange protein
VVCFDRWVLPRPLAALLVPVIAAAGAAAILLAPDGAMAVGCSLAFFGLGMGVAVAWVERARGAVRGAAFGVLGIVTALLALGGGAALEDTRPAPPIVFVTNDEAVAAIEAARLAHRPVVLDFGATWCFPTFHFDGDTKGHDAVRRASQGFVMIHVDASDDEVPLVRTLLSRYRVIGVPTVLVLDGEGHEAARLDTSFSDPGVMLRALRSAEPR